MDQSSHIKSAKTKSVSMVLVYFDKNKLSVADKERVQAKLADLTKNENKYSVLTISNPLTDPDLADIYISKDGTTLLVPITLDQDHRTVESIRNDITNIMKADGV